MKNKKLVILLSILGFLAVVVLLCSTVFTLKTVKVNWLTTRYKLSSVTNEEIIEDKNFDFGGSIFFLKKDKIASRLEELTSGDNNIEALEQNYNSLLSNLEILAESISEYRKRYSLELSKLIVEKLKNLELKEAQFEIAIKEISRNELGIDNVEFMISTNKNQGLAPLSKVASGGEISRVMLAIKSIFAQADKTNTVIFDEIDTGISGKASQAVADEISLLAKSHQIISITHQPIIAAKANSHFYVKKLQEDVTKVNVYNLDVDNKVKAIALLSAGEINEESTAFAKKLLGV